MICSNQQVTPAVLKELLRCDATSGKLYWLFRPSQYFSSKNDAAAWNGKWSGKEACITKDAYGYFRGRICGFNFKAHRVIWAMHYGEWPKHQIDHVNGIKTDNRIANLRDVTCAENSKNMPLQICSTSGFPGVTWCKMRQKWLARITSGRRCKNLGRFADKADAIAARKAAERLHSFHPNHGRVQS